MERMIRGHLCLCPGLSHSASIQPAKPAPIRSGKGMATFCAMDGMGMARSGALSHRCFVFCCGMFPSAAGVRRDTGIGFGSVSESELAGSGAGD